MDYSKLSAEVIINRIPRGTGDTDRRTMLLRLGMTEEEVTKVDFTNDDTFLKSLTNVIKPITLLEYIPANLSDIKGKAGTFLALDINNDVVVLPAHIIKIYLDKKQDKAVEEIVKAVESAFTAPPVETTPPTTDPPSEDRKPGRPLKEKK